MPPLHLEYPEPGITCQGIVGPDSGKHHFHEPGRENGTILVDLVEEDDRSIPLAQPDAFDVKRVSRALPNICQSPEHR